MDRCGHTYDGGGGPRRCRRPVHEPDGSGGDGAGGGDAAGTGSGAADAGSAGRAAADAEAADPPAVGAAGVGGRDGTDVPGRCVFHLDPAERRAAGVTEADLRAAVLADVEADADARREYVDVHLAGLDLDLESVVLDGGNVGAITLREVTVDGTLDLSGAVVGHPLAFEDCRFGRIDAGRATFEADVALAGTTVGDGSGTCLDCRRTTFERGLRLDDARFEGSVEFPACRVEEWLDVDGVTVAGRAHFPNAGLERAQFVDTTFEGTAGFAGATGRHVSFERVRVGDGPLDLSGAAVGSLRARPAGAGEWLLAGATVEAGRLGQPPDGVALYDLTDATVGDLDLEGTAGSFDRYRFYRTTFEGFAFTAYRRLLRAAGWRLHGYRGEPVEPADTEGLELTYLRAKRGAAAAGDDENASAFFVRELRHRRRRYAAHAGDAGHGPRHRAGAALRWATNLFLDAVAGYGERPGRILALAGAVVLGAGVAYPAAGGLDAGGGTVTYATAGAAAAVDGLYFSVVTFATLGLGDVRPVTDLGRLLAASEAVLGAFLTALFVFSLGRRVTR